MEVYFLKLIVALVIILSIKFANVQVFQSAASTHRLLRKRCHEILELANKN